MSELSPAKSPHEPLAQAPDRTIATSGLSSVLRAAGFTSDPITILDREQHSYVSTYPSEVVTCRISDGRIVRLLCKYSVGAVRHLEFGHRRGVAYEAEVYRSVLRVSSITAPRYYGTFDDPTTGSTCLVLEYLDGSHRMRHSEDGPQRAAQWLGHFHAINAQQVDCPSLAFLQHYDFAYYHGWIERTIQYASPLEEQFAWLTELEACSVEICEVLQSAPVTVVHGEYYSDNVLVHEGIIFPVDWESAAIAPGELDIASLTEGWGEPVEKACELAYCQARWPEGPPSDFARILSAARIYFLARWLGEEPTWTARRGHRGTGKDLRREIERWKQHSNRRSD